MADQILYMPFHCGMAVGTVCDFLVVLQSSSQILLSTVRCYAKRGIFLRRVSVCLSHSGTVSQEALLRACQ